MHLVVHYDGARFEGLLDGWSSAVQAGLVEGGLHFQGTTVVPIAPVAGRGLLRADADRTMRQVLGGGSRPDVILPIGAVTPKLDAAAVADGARRARALLTGSYVVVAAGTRVTLTPAQIAPTLGTRIGGHTLDLTVDGEKLRFALGPTFATVEQPPVDASFDMSNPDAVTVVPSRDGRALDTAAVGAAIVRGVAFHRRDDPAPSTRPTTPSGRRRSASRTRSRRSRRITSPGQPRVHNIHLAADTLNGTVVAPGETFSLNAKLGQRTPQKGYVQAPIEVESGFSTDYGGGISQLTTTLFNAVFFGGYVDVDHSPHRYWVSRYPMGREATIVWPYVDLKFRNDSKHGVLIRDSYSDTSVTVTFYGNTDGRVATEENRKILRTEPITDRLVSCPARAGRRPDARVRRS